MLHLIFNSITILEHTYNHKYSRCVSQPFSQSVAYSLSTPPSFTPFQYTSTTQQKNLRNNFIENFWEGWSYIYPFFEGGPLGYPPEKKPGSKCQIFHPPKNNPTWRNPTAPMFAGLHLDAFRNPLVSPDGKNPSRIQEGMEQYDFTYMKNHQNHRNVVTYASLMDPMGMIENSGVVGGRSEIQLLNKRSVDVKSFSWVMEFLQVLPQHFSCRESKSDFWTIYSRDRAVIQHLRIQNFGVLKTS